jgi:hypothetical protein
MFLEVSFGSKPGRVPAGRLLPPRVAADEGVVDHGLHGSHRRGPEGFGAVLLQVTERVCGVTGAGNTVKIVLTGAKCFYLEGLFQYVMKKRVVKVLVGPFSHNSKMVFRCWF